MPTLAIIDGIRILMYFNDHAPPHFHVEERETMGVFEIASGRMVRGDLGRRSRGKVERWIVQHRAELMMAWNGRQSGAFPKIAK